MFIPTNDAWNRYTYGGARRWRSGKNKLLADSTAIIERLNDPDFLFGPNPYPFEKLALYDRVTLQNQVEVALLLAMLMSNLMDYVKSKPIDDNAALTRREMIVNYVRGVITIMKRDVVRYGKHMIARLQSAGPDLDAQQVAKSIAFLTKLRPIEPSPSAPPQSISLPSFPQPERVNGSFSFQRLHQAMAPRPSASDQPRDRHELPGIASITPDEWF